MAFCQECGAPREPNAEFCTHCGAGISQDPTVAKNVGNATSADEVILAEYVVKPLKKPSVEGRLILSNHCLRLLFPYASTSPDRPRVSWTIPFNEVTQVCYRQDRPEAAIAVTIVSKSTISGPVPATLRNSDWLRQNVDAIQRGEIEVQQFTAPVRKQRVLRIEVGGRGPKMETKAYSYRIPEGWFFDQSGCSVSFYIVEAPPEEAGKLFARLFAIAEAGEAASAVSPSAQVPTELGHSLASGEKVLWEWRGKLPEMSWRLKMWFRLYKVSEPNVVLTTRRLIIEASRSGKVVEVSEYPLSALPCIGWLTSQGFGELAVKVNGSQAFPPTSKQVHKRTVRSFNAPPRDAAGVDLRPIDRAKACFDCRSGEGAVATKSLGSRLLLAREGRPPEDLSDRELNAQTQLTEGEREICSVPLTGAQDTKTMVWLTNRRLILESESIPPSFSHSFRPQSIASNRPLAIFTGVSGLLGVIALASGSLIGFLGALAFIVVLLLIPAGVAGLSTLIAGGRRLRNSTHLEVFIDARTRLSLLPVNKKLSAFVVSWSQEPPSANQVASVFAKTPIQIRLTGARPYSMWSLLNSKNNLIIPASPTEAQAAVAQLTRELMAVQESA